MRITDIIKKEDLGEPYVRLTNCLDMGEILKVEKEFAGRQIRFSRQVADGDEGQRRLILLLGRGKASQVLKMLGGEYVYFPKIRKSCLDKIQAAIRKEFDGYNYAELAKSYGYTERYVRSIIGGAAGHKKPYVFEGQISLLDDENS